MGSRPAATGVHQKPVTGNYFVAAYPPFGEWTPAQNSLTHEELSRPISSPSPPFGLYVHIPFCAKRCDFCYYLSYENRAGRIDDYLEAVLEELTRYAKLPAFAERSLDFVYFGGGTPSILSEPRIERLLNGVQQTFPWTQVRESTFECAPQTVRREKMRALRRSGISRISLGVQQLDDDVLKMNGRVHLCADVDRAFDEIRDAGFDVLNVDLISGLVGQTDDSFSQSLQRLIELEPDTVTIYQLEIPHNTPLFRSLRPNGPEIAPWSDKRRRIAAAFDSLERAGYDVVSAYAAARRPDPYRMVYMEEQYRGADLLGIGASSFSYVGGCHFQNIGSLDSYLRAMAGHGLPINRSYNLDDHERLTREFLLQLKLGRIERTRFQEKFGRDVRTVFGETLERMAEKGWLKLGDDCVELTRPGLLQVDHLVHEFFDRRTK